MTPLANPNKQARGVYEAESYTQPTTWYKTLQECQNFVDKTINSSQWQTTFPKITEVTLLRSTRLRYGATGQRTTQTIRINSALLPETPMLYFGPTPELLLHELAHITSPQRGHGQVYLRHYLWILEQYGNDITWGAKPSERLTYGLHVGGVRVAYGGLLGLKAPGHPPVTWKIPGVPEKYQEAVRAHQEGKSKSQILALLDNLDENYCQTAAG
jgi:hypothetical protein